MTKAPFQPADQHECACCGGRMYQERKKGTMFPDTLICGSCIYSMCTPDASDPCQRPDLAPRLPEDCLWDDDLRYGR